MNSPALKTPTPTANHSLASQLKQIGLCAVPSHLDDFIARVTKARCSAHQILEEIAKAKEGPFALPMPSDKRLQRLCKDLSHTPSIDFDIDHWADNLGMSRRTMTRKFRTQTGMSFAEWRRRLRMAHVMRRQAEGERLDEAAADVGYRSLSSLRKAMREVAA